MGKAYKAPTFHVTGITMRDPKSNPIIFALGVHTLDDHNIDTSVREAALYELCERLQPGIMQNGVIPYCMTDWGGCIIQVKKRHQLDEGWQRNFMGAALSCSQGMRLVIAVSEDVDPYSMDDIMWYLTTRVNPRADILDPIPGGRGQTFMPAERMAAGEKQWTASNTNSGRHGHRCDGAVRLRERLPASGLSGRPGQAGRFLHQKGSGECPFTHGRLGPLARPHRPLRTPPRKRGSHWLRCAGPGHAKFFAGLSVCHASFGDLILDATDRLGWLAGRVLADLGADVIKLEPPGSDRGRADWRAFNVNKRVLELDLGDAAGRAQLEQLLPSPISVWSRPTMDFGGYLDPDELRAQIRGWWWSRSGRLGVLGRATVGRRATWRGWLPVERWRLPASRTACRCG